MSEQRNIIRKFIDAAAEYGWAAGEAYSDHLSKRATYSQSSLAIDPFRNPGLLTTGFGLAAVDTSGFTSHFTAIKRWLPRSRTAFALDRKGNVAVMDLANNNASYIKALNASTFTNEDFGLEIHNDALFVAMNINASIAYLSRLQGISDLPSATWNVSFNVSLQAVALNSQNLGTDSQIKHPLVSHRGRLYVLQANKIDWTDGTTGVLTAGARLPENMVIKTGKSFGNQLIIGASANLFDNTYLGGPRVYFYDGISADWDSDVPFPDTDITNLEVLGGVLYGFGPNGFYEYDGSGFNKVDDVDLVVLHGSSDTWDGRMWFKGNNVVRGYGKAHRQVDDALVRVTTGSGSLPGVVRWVTEQKVIVTQYDAAQIYRHQASANETASKWFGKTIHLNGSEFYVRAINVGYENMSSGDGILVGIVDENGNSQSLGSVTYADDLAENPNHKDITEDAFTNPPDSMREFKPYVAFNAGRMKIRYLEYVLEVVPTI